MDDGKQGGDNTEFQSDGRTMSKRSTAGTPTVKTVLLFLKLDESRYLCSHHEKVKYTGSTYINLP